ncbi:uncharacterized protein BX664DRAFT_270689 [Halteromyces radiatus]|uniref:uncharacterized protein n=1 Tax=Halteromyces radiatus TaxID=101107 RepID=UPI00221FA790|nr:uncharacterized protein BX664DRAFT_270689 [Halteromyces radiatus]KAI8076877.1 hypothetical protein BX664DRAFT_270689 [Halteromyces radiatus]
MILLILYYVYKWMTVPWSYYESARSRRLIHFHATYHNNNNNNNNNKNTSNMEDGKKGKASPSSSWLRQEQMATELRRHELMGLIWVLASPAVAGYTLQYSRYFLSDYERYMSSFNVAVFVLAASLKPLSHVMLLLRERTMYLQSEIQVNETQVQQLQKKLDIMEDELYSLRQAFATKKDLGQVTDGLSPTIQQLTKAVRRFEKKEHLLRSWSEDKFTMIDEKVREFDQFICYKIDQDQRMAKNSTIATLVLLPLNITVWIAKSMTGLLPVPRALLGAAPVSNSSSSASFELPSNDHKPLTHRSSSSSSLRARSSTGKHLTHPDILSCPTTPDPPTVVY